MNSKVNLLSYTHHSFCNFIAAELGKGYLHAGLIYEEFYRTGTVSGHHPAFHNASRLLREILLRVDLSLPLVPVEKDDGETKKFLLKTLDDLEVEAVLIPMQAGGTLCISSQVGCRRGCTFCETGRMGLLRNLKVEEIIGQVFVVRHVLGYPIRNIVFMGMGEPFDNYENVTQATHILMDPKGLGFGRNHLTISTSGVIEGIHKFTHSPGPKPHLAVSINAPTDAIRQRLMPINRKHDMQQLYQAMREYNEVTGLKILTAYVLIKDVNDSLEHAERLADYLKGLHVKINLIPYNPQTGDRFARPTEENVKAFRQHLRLQGYQTLLRATKGKDIMAACGQLGNIKLRAQLKKNLEAV
ncbi:putative dual-specificity RNA methyltransferase RlmN 1|uniref:23S rRNA (adenine(2503)-C(2))-methyltransferase RlmN n=1 Tax=Neochlamydia sp. AcF84 TaxID=2315858 RepID=UPI0014097708|nr:23S rRNA (adenine(2503)-C(2))-methyltransferase RlmN [Neochlamydia sp. AcF84]NGY96040.1 putative dual-specificity RNA methyltransferase RlmN 1 [Neochlamydia sp. AcF84]